MPKLTLGDWISDTGEHEATGEMSGPSFYKLLTQPFGLNNMGAHLEKLPPGSKSGPAHRHSAEDEMVFVLQGQVTLWEDNTETRLHAGEAAIWKAGNGPHHCLQNDGTDDVVYLVVGTRAALDIAEFAEHDFRLEIDRRSGTLERRILKP